MSIDIGSWHRTRCRAVGCKRLIGAVSPTPSADVLHLKDQHIPGQPSEVAPDRSISAHFNRIASVSLISRRRYTCSRDRRQAHDDRVRWRCATGSHLSYRCDLQRKLAPLSTCDKSTRYMAHISAMRALAAPTHNWTPVLVKQHVYILRGGQQWSVN